MTRCLQDMQTLQLLMLVETHGKGSTGCGSPDGKELCSVALAHAVAGVGDQVLHLVRLHAHFLQELSRKYDLQQ